MYCTKKPKCSRESNHPGSCNKKRIIDHFHVASPVNKKNVLSAEVGELTEKKLKIDESIAAAEEKLEVLSEQNSSLLEENSALEDNLNGQNLRLENLEEKFEKLKVLICKKDYGRTRHEKLPTTWDMINNESSKKITRYNRLEETKDVLEYIHDGSEAALFGALDFIRRYAPNKLMEEFVLCLKKGKFIENLYGNFCKSSEIGKNQAIVRKYHGYLSRRKYDFLEKIISAKFDPSNQTWSKKWSVMVSTRSAFTRPTFPITKSISLLMS